MEVKVLALQENYPQLKSNENFLRLQDELAGTENRIAVERKRYDDAIQAYNTYIGLFPQSVVAGWSASSATTPISTRLLPRSRSRKSSSRALASRNFGRAKQVPHPSVKRQRPPKLRLKGHLKPPLGGCPSPLLSRILRGETTAKVSHASRKSITTSLIFAASLDRLSRALRLVFGLNQPDETNRTNRRRHQRTLRHPG